MHATASLFFRKTGCRSPSTTVAVSPKTPFRMSVSVAQEFRAMNAASKSMTYISNWLWWLPLYQRPRESVSTRDTIDWGMSGFGVETSRSVASDASGDFVSTTEPGGRRIR